MAINRDNHTHFCQTFVIFLLSGKLIIRSDIYRGNLCTYNDMEWNGYHIYNRSRDYGNTYTHSK